MAHLIMVWSNRCRSMKSFLAVVALAATACGAGCDREPRQQVPPGGATTTPTPPGKRTSVTFETSSFMLAHRIDARVLVEILDAVDREDASIANVSSVLGYRPAIATSWAGAAWASDGWAAAEFVMGFAPAMGQNAERCTGEAEGRRWVSYSGSKAQVWHDGDPMADRMWDVRFRSYEPSWRMALDPMVGLQRTVSRSYWRGLPFVLIESNLSIPVPQGLGACFIGTAHSVGLEPSASASLVWCLSSRSGWRIWVAAWGLANSDSMELLVGRAAAAPWPLGEIAIPGKVDSLYPTPREFKYAP